MAGISVDNVLTSPTDQMGEFMPPCLVRDTEATMLETFSLYYSNPEVLVLPHAKRHDRTFGLNTIGLTLDEDFNFQRKILPWDQTDLVSKAGSDKRDLVEQRKTHQSVIVCASLVDKLPNLAGLAR